MVGKLSKAKGKRGELEVAALLKKYGFEARRGQQYAGGGDSPDVVHSMESFHIEVKRTERFKLYEAVEQAIADKKDGETPLVFHRMNGKDWMIVIPADDFLKIAATELFK